MRCIFVVVLLFGVGLATLQADNQNEENLSEYTDIDTDESSADDESYAVANNVNNVKKQSKLNEIGKSNVDETRKSLKRPRKLIRVSKKQKSIVTNPKKNLKTNVDIDQLTREGKSESVKFSVMARENKLKNTLTKAVANGDVKMAKRALKNIRNPDPNLLHLAVMKGSVEIAKLLLQNGFDVDVKNAAQGLTPLCKAAQIGNIDMINLLLEHDANVNAKTFYGLTPLMLATAWSTSEHEVKSQIVKILTDHGADINDVDIGGRTALHATAFRANDDVDTVKLLIEFGANVNAREERFNETPLHNSVHRGNVGITRLLIKNGAHITVFNSAGDSLLHHAARFGRMELAKILLEKGADVNARNNLDSTPLHIIAEMGRDDGGEFARMLIENGADITARDYLNLTPYDVAVQKGQTTIASVLNEAKTRAH